MEAIKNMNLGKQDLGTAVLAIAGYELARYGIRKGIQWFKNWNKPTISTPKPLPFAPPQAVNG